MLWRCWLGGRKSSRPVKNWVLGCWRGYLPEARCTLAYGPADATATHFSKIQIGLPFWYRLTRVVPDKGPLNGCVYKCTMNLQLYMQVLFLTDMARRWSIPSVCDLSLCCLSCPGHAKHSEHCSQTYGLAPVCSRRWHVSCTFERHGFPQ